MTAHGVCLLLQSHHHWPLARLLTSVLSRAWLTLPLSSLSRLDDAMACLASMCTPPPIGVIRCVPFQTALIAVSTCWGAVDVSTATAASLPKVAAFQPALAW